MNATVRKIATAAAVVLAAMTVADADTPGQSYDTLQSGFTQSLFGVTSTFKNKNNYLGGVAALPNGDVMVQECAASALPQLHRFSKTSTTTVHQTDIHTETYVQPPLPQGPYCGFVYHPDGTLYLAINDGAHGIANVTLAGALARQPLPSLFGTPSNSVGIAIEPGTNHIIYAASTCVASSSQPCKLIDLDPVTGAATTRITFAQTDVQYISGMYFDPSGTYLFIDNRAPVNRLTVVKGGAISQHVALGSTQPVGIAFSASAPAFVITNNVDGRISRFDFPNDNYEQPPVQSVFASGGYRGDQMQVGPDGCAYVTQAGAVYNDGQRDTKSGTNPLNSLVRICGGFAPPPGVPPVTPTGTLTGIVTDAVTLLPLASATVALTSGPSVTTDTAGRYTFTVFPGLYETTASATNYTSVVAASLEVFNGLTTTYDFALMPLPGTLTGVVTNAAGAPVQGASVLLSNGKSATTDSAGRYTIRTIIPGTYTATVTQSFYDTLNATGIVVPTNATATYNFTLTQTPGALLGIVTDTVTGAPIAGATVALSNGASATTDATGAYAFAAVTPGVYNATASAATYSSTSASSITIANAASVTKNFALTPLNGTLQGVVTNLAGTPLANVKVQLSNGRSDNTDSQGRYTINAITPGTYGATATLSNYDTQTLTGIVIPNAATVTLNITMTQTPGTLKGVVSNSAGAPLAGATVSLSNGSSGVTDATGAYSIAGIMPATLTATVTLTNYNTLTVPGIVMPNAGTVTKNFTLTQTPGAIKGVVSTTAGAPIGGATVTLSTGRTTTTDPAGNYQLTSIAPGTYGISATASNFDALSATGITVVNATTTTYNITLTQTPGRLQGVVTDNGQVPAPIAGALITLTNGATATTDAGGAYAFASLMPGSYGAAVTAATYAGTTVSGIAVANAGSTTQNFVLSPLPGTLQGVVTDATTSAPVAGATVALSNGASALTTAAGTYSIASVAPGTYTATVTAATFVSAPATAIVIVKAATTTQNFALTPRPGTLQGVVSDTAGMPLAGAAVVLSTGASTMTGTTGVYAFTSLTPGTYGVNVTLSGYNGAGAAGIVVGYGATVTQDFKLVAIPGILQGVVSNVAGAPVAGAVVTLSTGASTATDSAGRYAFTSLDAGMYSVAVSALDYNAAGASGVVVSHAMATTQNFTLTQTPGVLQGRIVNSATSAPIAGATVRLSSGAATTTDGAGRYAISLLPGTYSATAGATNFTSATVSGLVMHNAGSLTRDFALSPFIADLTMAAAAPPSANAGAAVVYTFTTSNAGSAAASAVAVTHTLAAQTGFISMVVPAGWNCTKPPVGSAGTVSCSKPSMAVGESAAFAITAATICPFAASTLTVAATVTTSSPESSTTNNSASASTAVSTPAPTFVTASVDKTELWPPNHKMVDVEVSYTVANLTCASATTKLSVAGDDGMSSDDFEIVDDHHLRLRSERSGTSADRTYSITITATNDKAVAKKVVTVVVPHDQGKGK